MLEEMQNCILVDELKVPEVDNFFVEKEEKSEAK